MISINTHKILITLLFRNKNEVEKKIDFDKINYDDLVKLASSHLMIPALYINLKQNGLLNLVNNDFKKYIKYIYELNKSRNINLIKELRELSKLYIENEIDHVFLKGSSYLAYGRFNDVGERMIGDIDVLVSKSDYDKSIRLSKSFGYNYIENHDINYILSLDRRHYPRLVHSKKIFALEIHNRLLKKKNKLLSPNSLLQNKIMTEYGIYVPNKTELILQTIYNFQINDLGNLCAGLNYRSYYDISVYNSEINDLLKFNYSKYFNNYFLIADYIGVTNTKIKLNMLNKIYLYRFKAKRKYKIFYLLDNFICNHINLNRKRIINFFRLFTSSPYRSNLLTKAYQKFYLH